MKCRISCWSLLFVKVLVQGFPVSKNWSGSLEKSQSYQASIRYGPSSGATLRNAISMAFRWRVDDGPLIVVFGSYIPSSTKKSPKKPNNKIKKKNTSKMAPLWSFLWDTLHAKATSAHQLVSHGDSQSQHLRFRIPHLVMGLYV